MNPQNTDIYHLWGWVGVAVLAVAILLTTAILCHVFVKLVRKAMKLAPGSQRVGGSIIDNILRICIWAIGIGIMMYFCFDFNAGVIWGALGIGGVAVSLGAQTTISNLIGGLQVSFSKDVAVGDWVAIGAVTGQIRDITWRKVVVEDSAGDTHHIPNSLLVSATITRLSDAGKVMLPFVLDARCDIAHISRELPDAVFDAIEKAGMSYEDKRPVFLVSGTELAGISCTLLVFCSRAFATAQVSDVAMEAALSYLKDRNALAKSIAAS